MLNNPPLIIRLQIEQMQHTIVTALQGHFDGIKEEIEKAVDAEIEAFDFTTAVRNATRDALQKTLEETCKSFFIYGDGQKLIKRAIEPLLLEKMEEQLKRNGIF